MAANSPVFLASSVGPILTRACEVACLDPSGAELMRLGENMLFRLKNRPVVVRIARGSHHWKDALKEVAIANWLADEQFPAATLYPVRVPQPLDVDGYPVTFWRFIPGRAAEPTQARYLGSLLQKLHSLQPPQLDLPQMSGPSRIRARLELAPVPETDRTFLRERYDELVEQLPLLTWNFEPRVIHGDAHIKNVMMVPPDDRPVLIDFEAFGWGQPEWDLAKTATETSLGMLSATDYRAFADAYGFDVTEWPGFSVVRAVLQISMTSWIAQNVEHSTAIANEYQKRIEAIRTGISGERWQGF